MKWINIKEKLPPIENDGRIDYVLAFHTIYGVGVAWFNKLTDDEKELIEEDFKDQYICSCHFIRSKLDADYCIDDEDFIDIFIYSPAFKNLGTVTHWMELPTNPL